MESYDFVFGPIARPCRNRRTGRNMPKLLHPSSGHPEAAQASWEMRSSFSRTMKCTKALRECRSSARPSAAWCPVDGHRDAIVEAMRSGWRAMVSPKIISPELRPSKHLRRRTNVLTKQGQSRRKCSPTVMNKHLKSCPSELAHSELHPSPSNKNLPSPSKLLPSTWRTTTSDPCPIH